MNRLGLLVLGIVFAAPVSAQVFGPSGRVAQPVFRATAPQPGQSNAPIYSTTTTVVGAALGGILGSKGNRTGEGAALGGAVGLVLGQAMDRRVQSRETKQQADLERQQQAATNGAATAAGVPPVIPVEPAPPAPTVLMPAIDPNTGLPLPGQPATGAFGVPVQSPLRPANKLFGR